MKEDEDREGTAVINIVRVWSCMFFLMIELMILQDHYFVNYWDPLITKLMPILLLGWCSYTVRFWGLYDNGEVA